MRGSKRKPSGQTWSAVVKSPPRACSPRHAARPKFKYARSWNRRNARKAGSFHRSRTQRWSW
ncbi:MAG: hypothetical protein K8T25_09840 [Planctomycetia bacterium]|nr:hypothetical protein [Planctomycetia bacterium]